MRISFENAPPATAGQTTTAYQNPRSSETKRSYGYALDISGQVTDNTAYGFSKSQGLHGRSAEEIMQQADADSVSRYRNYMAVMSNSMSDEDFARLVKDGYDPSEMEVEDVVTILDTIKAQLLKAGVSVTGYTDTMSMDALTSITGSSTYAKQLSEAFAAEDVPLTEENVQAAMQAFEQGKELTEMSDGAEKYMVVNELPPQIDHLYVAQHAGTAQAGRQAAGYFPEELPGYFAQKAPVADEATLREQVERILTQAGIEVNEESIENGMWLVEQGIPLTVKTFSTLEDVRAVALPASQKDLFAAVATSLAEGRAPQEADLTRTKSIFRRAAETAVHYEEEYKAAFSQDASPKQIRARRQLEEIRLHMTVEANVKLLASGFSIDTEPMEKTIQALKELEEKQAGTEISLEDTISLCKETVAKAAEIPYFPAATVGRLLVTEQTFTVNTVYETGKSLQDIFEKAGEAYETMMTEPRADLGDNIRKAFRNVDELLTGMGLSLDDENRKAVRSLSYNQMELTEENLTAIKEASGTVNRVVEKLTPMSVLKMIRDGVNPLETSMEELDAYLADQDTYQEESTEYSKFLYQMEHNDKITPQEKESFIGVYRLVRQVEKSDGAVIGNLVGAQAEVNFKNLLSAIRTGKVKGVDVSVDDQLGGLKEVVDKGIAIDEQIEAAYERQRAREVRQAVRAGNETVEMLKQMEQPVTVDHLLAAEVLRKDGADSFKKLSRTAGRTVDVKEAESLLEKVFGENAIESVEREAVDRASMQEAYLSLLKEGEAAAKALTFEDGMGSLDIRALQLTCKQFHLQGARAVAEEVYDLPQIIDGEVTAVRLRLVHDAADAGKVSVGMDTAEYGYVSGEFTLKEDRVSGIFTAQTEEMKQMLEGTAEILKERLPKDGFSLTALQVVEGKWQDANQKTEQKTETRDLYKLAGAVIGAMRESMRAQIEA